MRKFVWLLLLVLFSIFSFAQTKQIGKQIKIFPDEYSELDDVPVTKQIEDPFIMKTLERARIKYLRALSCIERKDTMQAEENFEQAIDILNSISYYPNIGKFRDYTDLVQSIMEDYERYIRNIDHLDESSSLFLLRETLNKELEKTTRTKPTQVVTIKTSIRDTTKITENKLGYAFQIPMDDNDYVKKSIEFLTQKPIGRKFVRNSLARSTVWGSIIKTIIQEEAMPQELFYLAMVESGFNPFAVSRAKAVGIWQFIMSTGQLYGLNAGNSPWIDERRDPVKSTRAAMRHLRDLFNELGDWHLAIAAYNCGINAVNRAIAKFNKPDSVNFWNIMQFLPRETRNYVPLFIATVKVVTNLEAYGFSKSEIEYLPEMKFDKYSLKEPVSLNALAKCANISVDKLKELNPELLFSFTPPELTEYEFRIPFGSRQTFIANYLNLSPEEKQPFFIYRTEKKETIEKIAIKFNVEPKEILLVNNISSATKTLPKGTALKIPIIPPSEISNREEEFVASLPSNPYNESKSSAFAEDKKSSPKQETPQQRNFFVVRYIVKNTDNLLSISQKFNTSVDSIIQWNDLKSKVLTPGQTLRIYTSENLYNAPSFAKNPIPENLRTNDFSNIPKTENIDNSTQSSKQKVEKSVPVSTTNHHTVRKGETLQIIADKYDVTINNLLEWNPQLKKRMNTIVVGEKLKIITSKSISSEKGNVSTNVKAKKQIKSKYHTVQKGETLTEISRKYGISIDEIRSMNPKINPNKIKKGEKIKIN